MIIERYKSKYLPTTDDDLKISDDSENKLILNEFDDFSDNEQDSEIDDGFFDVYDEYEDEIGSQ